MEDGGWKVEDGRWTEGLILSSRSSSAFNSSILLLHPLSSPVVGLPSSILDLGRWENQMRKHTRLSILTGVISAVIAVATLQTHLAAVAEALTPAQTQSDFDLMRKALEEAHSGLYRYSSKPEMDRAFDIERAKLNRPLTKPEFLTVLVETLARIRCGHTGTHA